MDDIDDEVAAWNGGIDEWGQRWHQGCCVSLGGRGVGDECVVEGLSMGNGSWFEGENKEC